MFKNLLKENMSKKEALKILNAEGNETDVELKKKYNIASKENHPDLGGSLEAMKNVNLAYEILKTQTKINRDVSSKKDSFADFKKKRDETIQKQSIEVTQALNTVRFTFDLETFSLYLSNQTGMRIDGKVITSNLSVGAFQPYGKHHVSFSDKDKSIVFDVIIVLTPVAPKGNSLASPDYLEASVVTEVMYKRKKHKMGARDWKFTSNQKDLFNPENLFPENKILKIFKTQETKKVTKKDFDVALRKELGCYVSGDFYMMPLFDNFVLGLARSVFMRKGVWSAYNIHEVDKSGSFTRHKLIKRLDINSFYESANMLDYLIDELKNIKQKAKSIDDVNKMIQKIYEHVKNNIEKYI